MPAERNTSSVLAVLKILNILQKNKGNFNTNYQISPHVS